MAHYRRRLACHGLVGFIQSIQVSTKYVRSVRVHIVASVDGFDAAKERIFDAAQQKQPQEDIVPLTSFFQRQQEELNSIRVHLAGELADSILVDRPPIKGSSSERGRRSQSATAEVMKHSIPLPPQ